jgi:hypothetical protein
MLPAKGRLFRGQEHGFQSACPYSHNKFVGDSLPPKFRRWYLMRRQRELTRYTFPAAVLENPRIREPAADIYVLPIDSRSVEDASGHNHHVAVGVGRLRYASRSPIVLGFDTDSSQPLVPVHKTSIIVGEYEGFG